jgi:hypothetical protein
MTISEMYQEIKDQEEIDNQEDIIIDDYIIDNMTIEIEYDI